MDGWMDGRMDEWMDACMHVCMHGCVDGWMELFNATLTQKIEKFTCYIHVSQFPQSEGESVKLALSSYISQLKKHIADSTKQDSSRVYVSTIFINIFKNFISCQNTSEG